MPDREALLASLADYEAVDETEARSLAAIRRFVAESPDPFARSTPEGHVTGSAVVATPDGSAFLLVWHRKVGRWLQPGGHTEDADRTVFDAALREACEETGIAAFATPIGRAVLDVDVHAIPAHRRDPAHSHFDVRYLVTAPWDEEARARAEDPTRRMAWRTLEEALEAGVDASLERALRKAHAILFGVRA